jgi:hypothetical protein
MKMLMSAAALLLAAAGSAQAAPAYTPTGWYEGSWACTIANSTNQKLFMTLGGRSARAAVRDYPYYGKTEFKTLFRTGGFYSTVSFRGASGFLSLRRVSPGAITGTGRIGRVLMQLTCSRG